MKKLYSKPIVNILELRPEEKLATCQWPIGYWSGSPCALTWAQVPEDKDYCQAKYNLTPSSGS